MAIKNKHCAEDLNRINMIVLIAVQRCAEDLSSVLKITYPTCYEADPNALSPSRQGKGKGLITKFKGTIKMLRPKSHEVGTEIQALCGKPQ